MNPQIQAELQGNGASGIRQAGRYLLFGEDAFQKLRNALYNKLQSLHNQIVDSAKEELIVYIFAGVGGGTGSGTVIDIPYIVRKICGDNRGTLCAVSGIHDRKKLLLRVFRPSFNAKIIQ